MNLVNLKRGIALYVERFIYSSGEWHLCQFLESSAQPEDPECIGCIEIYAYDKNGNETGDCGEFEYHEGVYECMQDAVKDGLQFSNFPMNIPYKEISEEEFYKRIG